MKKILLSGAFFALFSLVSVGLSAQTMQTLSKVESQQLKATDYKQNVVKTQTIEEKRRVLTDKLSLQEVGSPAYLKLKALLEEL